VRRFRISFGVYLVGNVLLLALDLALTGSVDFAPVVTALWTVLVASQYARLWMEGFTWRGPHGAVGLRSVRDAPRHGRSRAQ
jgi:hypothetical protein